MESTEAARVTYLNSDTLVGVIWKVLHCKIVYILDISYSTRTNDSAMCREQFSTPTIANLIKSVAAFCLLLSMR